MSCVMTEESYSSPVDCSVIDLLPEQEMPIEDERTEPQLGFYARRIKRPMDVILSSLGLVVLAIPMGFVALAVAYHLGTPVIFKQKRPGMKDKNDQEKIFTLYKFRTMSNECDEDGNILPDDKRLDKFGAFLRKTSMDELPELWNILKGDMSVVGLRPQLVRDMMFMTDDQRRRHDVRPGLTGWAQINGRNCISWDDKLNFDLQYMRHVDFLNDWKIILITIVKVFRTESITFENMATAEDYRDYLLRMCRIDKDMYDALQLEARRIIDGRG